MVWSREISDQVHGYISSLENGDISPTVFVKLLGEIPNGLGYEEAVRLAYLHLASGRSKAHAATQLRLLIDTNGPTLVS